LENWFKLEFLFTKNLGITPLELDKMEFYRVEYMIMNYEEFIKEENKQYKQQEKDQGASISKQRAPNFQIPKMQIPKITPPKF